MASPTNRRRFIAQAFLVGTTALLSQPALAKKLGSSKKEDPDGRLLAELLDVEYQVIFASNLLAGSPQVNPDTRPLGVSLKQSHESHRETLTLLLTRRGEHPKASSTVYTFDDAVETEKDLLKLLARLERGAADAYMSRLERFTDRQIVGFVSPMMADAIVHLSELRRVLNLPPVFAYRDLTP